MKRSLNISSTRITFKDKRNVHSALASGWISHRSPLVSKFEDSCVFLGGKNRVAVANGTVAIEILLRSAGVGPGDEVITSALTYAATANAIIHVGAIPIIADVDLATWQIDLHSIKANATQKTKAILAVSLYGNVPDIAALEKLANDEGWFLFFDNAEAHGAKYFDTYLGNFGTGSTTSFYANKLIATGEGGMVITNSDEIAIKIRHLINHSQVHGHDFYHDEVGWNYRFTGLAAALGLGQVARFNHTIKHHEKLLSAYKYNLKELTSSGKVVWMQSSENATPVTWLVSCRIRVSPDRLKKIREAMSLLGIETRPFFVPLSRLPYMGNFYTPNADLISGEGLCLPTHHKIKMRDVKRICRYLVRLINENDAL
jgi:perosamine synthetase